MNLPRFAMTHKPLIFAIVAALFFLGIKTFLGISRREDPELIIRNCVVITQWPGAPAEKIEDLVTTLVLQRQRLIMSTPHLSIQPEKP